MKSDENSILKQRVTELDIRKAGSFNFKYILSISVEFWCMYVFYIKTGSNLNRQTHLGMCMHANLGICALLQSSQDFLGGSFADI
jgi:hypothetical protein